MTFGAEDTGGADGKCGTNLMKGVKDIGELMMSGTDDVGSLGCLEMSSEGCQEQMTHGC